MSLSKEQQLVVDLPLGPICVTACAGSGKTRTAVHRLHSMRSRLNDQHGLVALLSFSNVAVDTFRSEYYLLTRVRGAAPRMSAVEIDTVDGFITTNVLRPHACRTMGAPRTAFLVEGREPFLSGFTVFDGVRPHPTADLRVRMVNDRFQYEVGKSYAAIEVDPKDAEKAIGKLGKVGAYTHSIGRYWAIQTLREQPPILRALSRRYPHILVDEAQDIGREHQVVLELLIKAGSQVSLIGDQHQGIYDFSGASGEFLAGYGEREDVSLHNLTTNYRSVPSILNVANNLAGRNDSAERAHPAVLNGAFYLPYSKSEKSKALAAFKSLLDTAELDHRDAVVLCRSTQWVEDWRGGEEEQGQGIVRSFVNATISRDKLHRHGDAFDQGCMGLIGLLDAGQITLRDMIKRGGEPNTQQLRRAIWSFIRDSSAGLPAGTLLADTEWHPALVDRVKRFLVRLEREFSLKPAANIGNKLAKKELSNRPIVQLPDLAAADIPTFRVSTVHQVKGESIDAVMYVADRSQIQSLIGGTGTEVGRIGYVAVTRARNLFVLGVPDKHIKGFEPDLQRLGFKKLGA